jgi:hypothetical protein
MYLDLSEGGNLSQDAMATFKETGPSREVVAVFLFDGGQTRWCAVTGWETGPRQALVTPIEESGDGPALLLHGGSHGIRLAGLAATSMEQAHQQALDVDWNLEHGHEWGEPFIICLAGTVFAYRTPALS